ncbi:MAG TPA: GAF and ANTAR domain-containing protein [Streptosporangiaceae bacterium]|nr:GAF and ANTAR domain-containing protein [Streptosporangiaceae bacterium]
MPGSDLADRAAALLSLAAATEERALSQLTALAASQVHGCAAATVTVWREGELASQAASHPEPSRLIEVQVATGRGPLIDAIADGTPVSCRDTLTETRWPEFTAAALRIGIRSSVTLSYRGSVDIALSLFGLRPRALDTERLQLAELLVAYGGALVGAVSDYDDTRRVARQLQDAAESRAVVDQAKGILMHALGCSAEEALERMREVSQRSNLRATEVARRVIDAHSRPGGRAGRQELGQLAELAGRPRKASG